MIMCGERGGDGNRAGGMVATRPTHGRDGDGVLVSNHHHQGPGLPARRIERSLSALEDRVSFSRSLTSSHLQRKHPNPVQDGTCSGTLKNYVNCRIPFVGAKASSDVRMGPIGTSPYHSLPHSLLVNCPNSSNNSKSKPTRA